MEAEVLADAGVGARGECGKRRAASMNARGCMRPAPTMRSPLPEREGTKYKRRFDEGAKAVSYLLRNFHNFLRTSRRHSSDASLLLSRAGTNPDFAARLGGHFVGPASCRVHKPARPRHAA